LRVETFLRGADTSLRGADGMRRTPFFYFLYFNNIHISILLQL
jgi:hypothetical protein